MPLKRSFGAVAGQAGGAPFVGTAAPTSVLAATSSHGESMCAAAAAAEVPGLGTGAGGSEYDAEKDAVGSWMKLTVAAVVVICLFVLVRNGLRMVERRMLFPGTNKPAPFAAALKGSDAARFVRLGVKSYTAPQDDGAPPVRYFAVFPSEPPSSCAGSVVVLHGNNCTAADCIMDMVPTLTSVNVAVFLVEYPGYASDPSNTKPSECAILDNAVRVIDHLTLSRHAPWDKPVMLLGQSLGCAVAMHVAHKRPKVVHSLFLLSPFTSVADVVATRVSHFPFKWFIKSNFDTGAWVRNVVCPVTIAHGSSDMDVPLHLGEKLAAQFAVKPTFVLVDRGGHHDMLAAHGDKVWPACTRAVEAAAEFKAVMDDMATGVQ